ncbi:hypothetical protein [Chondromyces crocatus]|uniref:hypothetical protein n=1 Tax=Chondromyces crocatus TaxID=52 RepID=UPI0012E30B7C|nr:hypothetical protein [Chondromyces crocatus]
MSTNTWTLGTCAAVAAALSAGCATPLVEEGDADPAEEIATDESALLSENALNWNAINWNALNWNALNWNALNWNGLTIEARNRLLDSGNVGDLARQALRYVVSCALPASSSFDFSWRDDQGGVHAESYPGLMALAPQWQSSPITDDEARWVSACLLSRVNYYGASVLLSSRSWHQQFWVLGGDELATFTHEEGAFWGNLFTDPPSAYACYNTNHVDYARQKQRACAAGHVNAQGGVESCGMIKIVGACSDYCVPAQTPSNFWMGCTPFYSRPSFNFNVITVFLD